MKLMKETNSDASSVYAAMNNQKVPLERPAPVGSEDVNVPHSAALVIPFGLTESTSHVPSPTPQLPYNMTRHGSPLRGQINYQYPPVSYPGPMPGQRPQMYPAPVTASAGNEIPLPSSSTPNVSVGLSSAPSSIVSQPGSVQPLVTSSQRPSQSQPYLQQQGPPQPHQYFQQPGFQGQRFPHQSYPGQLAPHQFPTQMATTQAGYGQQGTQPQVSQPSSGQHTQEPSIRQSHHQPQVGPHQVSQPHQPHQQIRQSPPFSQGQVIPPQGSQPPISRSQVGLPQAGQSLVHQPPNVHRQVGETQPGQPHVGQPQVGQSQVGLPQVGQPQVDQPQVGQPHVGQPQVGQPQVGQPQVGQPQVGQPQVGQPQVGQPQVGQPHVGQPQVGQPHIGQPQVGQPQLDAPHTGQALAGHPQVGQQIGQPLTGQPHAGQTHTGHPQVGQSQVGQHQVAQHQAGQPQVGQPQAGQPQVGQPQAGQPQVGQPQAGQPQAGQPQSGQPQAGSVNLGLVQPSHIHQSYLGHTQPQIGHPQPGYQQPGQHVRQPSPQPMVQTTVNQSNFGQRQQTSQQTGQLLPYSQSPAGQPSVSHPVSGQVGQPQVGYPQQGIRSQYGHNPSIQHYPTNPQPGQSFNGHSTMNRGLGQPRVSQPMSQPQVSQPQANQTRPQLQQNIQQLQYAGYPSPQRPVYGQQGTPNPQSPATYYQQMRQQHMVRPQSAPSPQATFHQTPVSSPQPQVEPEVKLRPVVPQPGTVPIRPPVIPTLPLKPAVPQMSTMVAPKVERRTSLDDMLDELEDDDASVVLVPKVMTPGEVAEQKKLAKAMEDIAQASNKDPYDEEEIRGKLLADVEKLSTELSDPKFSNEKWKLLNSHNVDKIGGAVSVARCYPMKNRAADVLPFDSSRVELPTTKDDYINASHIRHLSTHSPCFIVTQWPKPNTFKDFWIMVWQEQVETVVALNATAPAEQDIYWPSKEEPLQVGSSGGMDLEVTLQSVKTENSVTLRIMTVMNKTSNTSRVVIHLQIMQDKGKSQVELLSELSETCLSYYRQQRVLTHPILVHCTEGAGKSSSFVLMLAAMSEVDVANVQDEQEFLIIPDLVKMGALLSQQRKGVLRERQHLKQAYEGVLDHSKQILINKGVMKPEIKAPPASTTSDLSDIHVEVGGSLPPSEEIQEPQLTLDVKEAAASDSIFQSQDMLKNLNLSDPLGLKSPGSGTSPRKKKITKQDFANAESGLKTDVDKDDPLSQLDPLWSMKK